jgi:hypothetical protein
MSSGSFCASNWRRKSSGSNGPYAGISGANARIWANCWAAVFQLSPSGGGRRGRAAPVWLLGAGLLQVPLSVPQRSGTGWSEVTSGLALQDFPRPARCAAAPSPRTGSDYSTTQKRRSACGLGCPTKRPSGRRRWRARVAEGSCLGLSGAWRRRPVNCSARRMDRR